MNEVKLTNEELDRVLTVFAYNIDFNVQKELNKAMEKKNEADVARLLQLKASDQAILGKMREAIK